MKWGRWFSLFGVGLLGAAFVVSVVRMTWTKRTREDPDVVTIRFAHWQLESGLRAAYEEMAGRYMELHPKVRVEQMAIPERVYGAWMRTQLVGRTAPDLIEFGQIPLGVADELLARNFTPLTAALEQPNPYNAGTPLANVPWRETFIDGLEGVYRSTSLQEYFKIPTSIFTVRVYYNRTLWKEILADTPEPQTFAELQQIGRKVEAHARATGSTLFPMAGSSNSLQPLDRLFASQTQRLAVQLDLDGDAFTSPLEIGVAALRGEWGVESPELARSLELVRAYTELMPAGYQQLSRSDAMFHFIQGRALMITTGSWDATSLISQVPFEIGVFRIPLPTPDDPVYGAGMLSAMTSEADTPTEASFSLWNGSPHAAQALDFLRFITSVEGMRLFVQHSRWLPSILGVEPAAGFEAFMPVMAGSINGFDASLGNVGPEVRRLWDSGLSRLSSPGEGVEMMRALYRDQFHGALRSDLERWLRTVRANSIQQDTTLAAWLQLARTGEQTEPAREKFSELFRQQNRQESEAYWIAEEMRLSEVNPP